MDVGGAGGRPLAAAEKLVHAVAAIGSDLDLPAVLERIVQTATTLVGARYGALGVLRTEHATGDRLAEFVTEGLTVEQVAQIDHRPRGEGILGLLIDDPRPLRLADLTTHPRSVGFPPGHPPMYSFLGVPIRVRGTVFGNLYLADKAEGLFTADDERIVTALAGAAGVAVDNAWAHEESLYRERWLRAVVTIRTAILSGTPPPESLRLIVRTAAQTARAASAALALRVRDGWRLEVVVPDRQPGTPPVGTILADAAALGAALGPGATITVPADGSNGTWGLLALRFADGSGPRRTTEQMLTSYASQSAVAVELAAARSDAEQLALMGDRDRIARDLHDVVIQRLFACGMQLQSTQGLVTDETAAARVRGVVDDLDETIAQIRSAIYALQTSPALGRDGAGIRSRLLALADRSAPALGLTPSVRFDGAVDALVDSGLADHLVAVTSEALSNVARHASASHASVSLAVSAERATLVVADDGVGTCAGGRRSGLVNLAHRAESLGGTLEVEPGHPTGTRLVWSVPTGAGG